jgi:acyl carrier protein
MVFEKVKAIVAEKLSLNPEEVMMESNLQADFGADSLDAVEIIMGVEEAFEIEISDEEIAKIKFVKDIVNHIENLK